MYDVFCLHFLLGLCGLLRLGRQSVTVCHSNSPVSAVKKTWIFSHKAYHYCGKHRTAASRPTILWDCEYPYV